MKYFRYTKRHKVVLLVFWIYDGITSLPQYVLQGTLLHQESLAKKTLAQLNCASDVDLTF
jgi:hypothetical protein